MVACSHLWLQLQGIQCLHPLKAPGMHVVPIHICLQNTHAWKVDNSKRYIFLKNKKSKIWLQCLTNSPFSLLESWADSVVFVETEKRRPTRGLSRKGACYKVWWSGFDPSPRQSRRRELTSRSWPLTSTLHTIACVQTYKNVTGGKKKSSKSYDILSNLFFIKKKIISEEWCPCNILNGRKLGNEISWTVLKMPIILVFS